MLKCVVDESYMQPYIQYGIEKTRFKDKFNSKIHGNNGILTWSFSIFPVLSNKMTVFVSISQICLQQLTGRILRAKQIPNAKNYTLKTSQRAITWRLRGIGVDKIRPRLWNNSIEISVRSIIYSFPTWAVYELPITNWQNV